MRAASPSRARSSVPLGNAKTLTTPATRNGVAITTANVFACAPPATRDALRNDIDDVLLPIVSNVPERPSTPSLARRVNASRARTAARNLFPHAVASTPDDDASGCERIATSLNARFTSSTLGRERAGKPNVSRWAPMSSSRSSSFIFRSSPRRACSGLDDERTRARENRRSTLDARRSTLDGRRSMTEDERLRAENTHTHTHTHTHTWGANTPRPLSGRVTIHAMDTSTLDVYHARMSYRIQYLVKSIQIYKKYSVLQSHTIHHLSQTRHTSHVNVYAPPPTRGTGWWPTHLDAPIPDDRSNPGFTTHPMPPPRQKQKTHPHGMARVVCPHPLVMTRNESPRTGPSLIHPRVPSAAWVGTRG